MRTSAVAALALACVVAQFQGAEAATLSGVFINPIGPPDLVVSGVGSNVIRTGVPTTGAIFPTILRFDPSYEVPEVRGRRFVGGVIGFRNGTIMADTGFSS